MALAVSIVAPTLAEAETTLRAVMQSDLKILDPIGRRPTSGPSDLWTHPPFEPVISGDWLCGRGGADMKAGHAANLFALDALKRIGLQPAATVYLQSVVEEESTGNGALMTHLRGYPADAALIPEPMDEKLVRANVGVLWFQIEVRGHTVHFREMGAGANAIDDAYRVIGELRKLEASWNGLKVGHAHFDAEPHPINLNIGKIEGGDWASSVPAWCRVDCRISPLPGVTAAAASGEIQRAIETCARNDAFLAIIRRGSRSTDFSQKAMCLRRVPMPRRGEAHGLATGEALRTQTSAAYLDARVYALYDDIPALCYGPSGRDIHGSDERVSLASVRRVTKTMALFIASWCGLEPVSG